MPRTVRTDRDSHSGSLMACRGLGDLFAEPAVFFGLGLFPLDVGPAALGGGPCRGDPCGDGRGFAGLLAGEDLVEPVRQRQGDVDSDVDAKDGGDQVGHCRHAEDGFLVRGIGRDDAGRRRRHHGAGPHAGAHGQGQRIEDLPVGHQRSEQRDEHGAEEGSENIHGQHTTVLVRIGTVLFGDHGE